MTSTAQRDPRSRWRPVTSRRVVAAVVAVVFLAAAGAWVAGWRPGDAGRVGARSLSGVPLQGPAGLRLLVADDPTPFVLDVDSGASQPVTGLPTGQDRTTHVESVGGHAVVVSRWDCRGGDCDAGSLAFLVRRGSTAASPLGRAMDVEWSRDGRGVWLLRRQDATRCILGQVGLDGRQLRPTQPMPCEAVLIEELPAGLLVYGSGGDPYSALVRADGTVRRLPVVADGAVGDLLLSTVEPGREIALTDARSGATQRLPWPSGLDDHVMGLIGRHPDGRLASVAFYPAHNRAEQTLDVWLLDLTTRRWHQLPDMPLRIAPSKPQLRWTADGRLLLLAGLAHEPDGMVALWRPGEPRIAVRRVNLPGPEQPDGFRFAIW